MGLAPLHDERFVERERICRLARLRALSVFAAIVTGYVVADLVPLHPGISFGIGLLAVAISLVAIHRTAFLPLFLAAVCITSAGYFQLRLRSSAPDGLARRIDNACSASPTQSVILKLRGTLESNFTLTPGQGPPLGQYLHLTPSARNTFRVTHLYDNSAWVPACGTLWLKVELLAPTLDALKDHHAAECVELTGIARPLHGPSNPGEFDLRDWATDHSIVGSLTLSSADLLTTVDDSPALLERIRRAWNATRSSLTTRAHAALDRAAAGAGEEDRALLFALVLGDTPTDQTLNQAFLRLGLAHVLAISGFHLVVMVQVFLLLIRLSGDRGRLETILAIFMVIAYMAIVPAQAPIIRSGAICILMLLAEWLGRRYDAVTLLIWIASALIIIHPTDLQSLGYQLSCGLTVILVWLGSRARAVVFAPHIAGLAHPPRHWSRELLSHAAEHVRSMVSTTLLCSLASVPLIVYRTGTLSPLVLLATVLVVPLITVLLWLAFVVLAAGVAILPLAALFSPFLTALTRLVTWVIHSLDGLPFAQLRVHQPDWLWCAAATALILIWFIRGRVRDSLMWFCASILIVWCTLGWTLHSRTEHQRALRIDMLSVGDGSCLVLRSGGRTCLWDAGSLRPGMGSDTVVRALAAMDVTRIDAVYITHPDIDHFGGLPQLVRTFGITQAYTCERFLSQARTEPTGAAAALAALLAREGCALTPLAAGARLAMGACAVSILSPPGPEPDWKADNEHSLLALLSAGERQLMLLTGDAQDHAILTTLVDPPHPLALEAPHHGAYTVLAERLLRATAPQVVLQSTGQHRERNPKWDGARSAVAQWLVTNRDGACWIEFNADGTYTTGHLGK